MGNWHDYAMNGQPLEWPYPIRYDSEQTIETDILVIGGGIAGCWAAISAARMGAHVAIVEKAATIRSGAGGPGCDHWCETAANPLSKVDPTERARQLSSGYANGIGRMIQCRENYDTLLELEQMGGKIRDINGEYRGAEGWDEKTRFVVSPRTNSFHETNLVLRVWGTTFKPALTEECQRLGVKIYDRVMATCLLNQEGIQGQRIVGATGINNRTGEFMVFRAKATILCIAGPASPWIFNTELAGITGLKSRVMSGDGIAMAWRAGAELTMMENSSIHRVGGGYRHHWYTGAGDASYENVPLVDASGKGLPIVAEPSWGMKTAPRLGGAWDEIRAAVLRGEYELPFYGDFPSMPPIERKATWNLLLSEESVTKVIVDSYAQSGFDPAEDRLMAYQLLEGNSPAQWRDPGFGRGGLLCDWNLQSSVEGLYAAGEQLFAAGDHSFAAATGRYAGRKAVDFTLEATMPEVSRDQIEAEKARVYAPLKNTQGIDWKELRFAIARTMQYFCSEYKTDRLLNMGLESLREIEDRWMPQLYASDPHKLMCCLESVCNLTYAKTILEGSLARKASSQRLGFQRIDYPQMDPPDWDKFITLKLANSKLHVGERPFGYWGDLEKNYEAHNRDYTGVWKA